MNVKKNSMKTGYLLKDQADYKPAIAVVAYNRLHALNRILYSLDRAQYSKDKAYPGYRITSVGYNVGRPYIRTASES